MRVIFSATRDGFCPDRVRACACVAVVVAVRACAWIASRPAAAVRAHVLSDIHVRILCVESVADFIVHAARLPVLPNKQIAVLHCSCPVLWSAQKSALTTGFAVWSTARVT